MKRNRTGAWAVAALSAAAVLLFVFSRAVSVELVYPFERFRLFLSRSVVARISSAFRAAETQVENASLRREIGVLTLIRAENTRLEEENARLREALGYQRSTPGKFVFAAVLSRGGAAAGAHETIRVNRGSIDGVKSGSVVVVPAGLVGRVTSVSLHTAEVLLVTDRKLKVACEIELSDGTYARGIISGSGDELLVLNHLTGVAEVPPRARVFTSGLGGVFPRGIEVGALLEIRKDSKGLARAGEVLPSVDCRSLEDVFIRCEE